MNSIRKSVGIAAIVALTSLGCATTGDGPAPSVAERTCFRVSQVNSYAPIDDHHVIVSVTGNEKYLLTLHHGCPGLNFARGISISERSSSFVCGDGSGLLTFNKPGMGAFRCRIITIDSVENEDEATQIIQAQQADK